MSRTYRFIAALGAVLFAVTALAACGSSGVPGDAVASVEGTPITTAAFKHWMSVAAASSSASTSTSKPAPPEPPHYTACIAHERELAATELKGKTPPSEKALKQQCETQYKSLLQEVLSFLVSSQWVIEEGKTVGVNVSDAEVKKQFNKIVATQFTKPGELQKFVSASGQTVSDLLLRVKLNLLSSKIQQKIVKEKATITTAAAEKYYNENKSHYGSPEKRNVAIILTKSEAAAAKAKSEIQGGKSFASVAKAVSVDPASKASGGLLTGVVKGQEEKGLDEAIFSAQKGVLTGPVKTSFGYYILEVKSVTPGTQQSFAQVHTQITEQLKSTRGQEALTKFVKEFKTKWKAKTDCRSGYVVADCKQYKAPKGTSTTSSIPPTGEG